MPDTASRPLVAGLARTGRPHIRVSNAGLNALAQFRDRLGAGDYELVQAGCICAGGGANSVLVAQEDRYGLPFETYLCRDCGLIFTSPRMSARSIERFYQVEYRAIYRGFERPPDGFYEDQARHGRQILKRLRSYVKPAASKVFDVGCGAGGVLAPFKAAGAHCMGCDYNEHYLQRGRDDGLVLETGDWRSLLQHAPADLLIASHVLEHCLDPVEELKNWASLLSNDGNIYIEVPGLFHVYRNYKSLAAFFHVAHTFNFTLDTLRSVAAAAGLRYVAGDESIWAVFSKSEGSLASPPPDIQRIERFLARREEGPGKLLRESRRHLLRQVRGVAKRLPFNGK